jgi:hypothetical protein
MPPSDMVTPLLDPEVDPPLEPPLEPPEPLPLPLEPPELELLVFVQSHPEGMHSQAFWL